MKFLLDAMLPPQARQALEAAARVVVTPGDLGAQNLPDNVLVEIASADAFVIVTENAMDFADVETCPVLFVRKSWWPHEALAERLGAALVRWAAADPDLGPWAHWLDAEFR